jgi:hypothetical protein
MQRRSNPGHAEHEGPGAGSTGVAFFAVAPRNDMLHNSMLLDMLFVLPVTASGY